MKRISRRLTYANVIATIALFLALGGGVVLAAGKFNGKQIKKNSIPGNRLKKKAVTAKQVKPGTITRALLAGGTLSGVTVADATASSIPVPNGTNPTPVTLNGNTNFTPASGKSYLVQVEVRGSAVPANNSVCSAGVQILANGLVVATGSLLASNFSGTTNPSTGEGSGTGSMLTESGAQTLTARVPVSGGCAAGTAITAARVTVSELG